MIELEKFEKNDETWRVRMTVPGFLYDSQDDWDVPTEELADTFIKALDYAHAIGEGVHSGSEEELRRLREVWDKHEIPQKGRNLCMALNEVLLHYKGFLKAEKQDKEHRRGPMEVLSSEIQHLSQLLGWSKQGVLCNGCSQHKDFCRCAEVEAMLTGKPRRTATEQAALDKQYQGIGKEGMINVALSSEPGPLHAWGVAEKKAQFDERFAATKKDTVA